MDTILNNTSKKRDKTETGGPDTFGVEMPDSSMLFFLTGFRGFV